MLKELIVAGISLGTFLCQQHGKQSEFERQQAEAEQQAKQEFIKTDYAARIELMKQQCPPIQTLGANPSDQVLAIYQQNCAPMNAFLMNTKAPEPKAPEVAK